MLAAQLHQGNIMKTTVEFLDALRAQRRLSDRKAAALLGLSQAAVSRWRTGRDFPGDHQCIKLAQLLALDPGYVMACIHAERARLPDDKAAWQRIAERLGGMAAAVLVGVGLAGAPSPSQAAFNIIESGAQQPQNTHMRIIR